MYHGLLATPVRRATVLVATALLVAGLVSVACTTSDPSSPNTPTELTGQNPNEDATFQGTITITRGVTAPADGVSDAILTATVREADGNPVSNGVPVNFQTDLGTVRAVGSDPATAGNVAQIATFDGKASVAVQSSVSGVAQVTVSVANVSRTTKVTFTANPAQETISLAFRISGADSETTQQTAPVDLTVVALVKDEASAGVSGRRVRFRIEQDSSNTLGAGGAQLVGPKKTETNAAGEAFNVVNIRGGGRVVLVAELLANKGNKVVGQSNQVVATTTTVAQDVVVALTFTAGGTFQAITAPDTVGMLATVTDVKTAQALGGRRVRFRIVQDSALVTPATLANGSPTFTNGNGEASNAITGTEAGSTVSVVAELLDASGAVEATSNQIVLAVQ